MFIDAYVTAPNPLTPSRHLTLSPHLLFRLRPRVPLGTLTLTSPRYLFIRSLPLGVFLDH